MVFLSTCVSGHNWTEEQCHAGRTSQYQRNKAEICWDQERLDDTLLQIFFVILLYQCICVYVNCKYRLRVVSF